MTLSLAVALVRWLLSAALLYNAYRIGITPELATTQELDITTGQGVASGGGEQLLIAMGSLVGGIALIGPELVRWISIPFQGLFNGIFFPGTSEIPPPDYNVTRVYREQGRHEEAVERYWQILHHHPGEVLAYVEGIQSAFDAGQPAVADKFRRTALRKLEHEPLREQIEKVYAEALAAAQAAAEEAEGEPLEDEATGEALEEQMEAAPVEEEVPYAWVPPKDLPETSEEEVALEEETVATREEPPYPTQPREEPPYPQAPPRREEPPYPQPEQRRE